MQPDLYVKMYEKVPPLPSRLDQVAVARLLRVWPCRNTNKFAKGPAGSLGDMSQLMLSTPQMIQQGLQVALQQQLSPKVP